MVDLRGLDEMDPAEVDSIARLVSSLFGPFHPNVAMRGVYFWNERFPQMVYLDPDDRFEFAVCLPKHQEHDGLARLVHLSHELVHCLNPNGLPSLQATVLEEGLAEHAKVYLAREFYQDQVEDGFDFRKLTSNERYRAAFDQVEALVKFEGLEEMRTGIRVVRQMTDLPFGKLTQDHLNMVFKQAPKGLLHVLSEKFHG